VKVRSPQLDQLQGVLQQQQLVTRVEDIEEQGKVLFVEGEVTTDQVGEAAAAHGVVLHELTLQRGSLEQAFMQMTGDSVEYHAHDEIAAVIDVNAVPPVSGAEVAAGSKGDN
jgi:ABC-2 type transport system ATP-binding protein